MPKRLLTRSLIAAGVIVGTPIALTAALVAVNEAAAPFTTRAVLPTFEYYEADEARGGDPTKLFVIFHGLWSSDWGRLQLDYFQARGNVLLVINGVVDLSPPATLVELKRLELLDQEIHVVGFSMGTITAVEFLRCFREDTGRDIPYVLLVCGPAAPEYVIWPWAGIPLVLARIEGGPVLQALWRHWLADVIAEDGESAARSHAASVVSGVRMLIRGPRLVEGEFPNTEAHFIEHETDYRVHPCSEVWRSAFGSSTRVEIQGRGHGDFDIYKEDYTAAYNGWPCSHKAA